MTSRDPRYFEMDEAYREGLRRPFAPEQIGKLPKPYSKDAQKGNCKECGGYHGLPAMHLDYAGHAAVTYRLNEAAPDWSYEIDPVVYLDSNAMQHVLAVPGRMTIGGKTLPEVGEVDRTSNYGSELKLGISDFIRRGAMRFGVGLDLWSKEDLSSGAGVIAEVPTEGTTRSDRAGVANTPAPDTSSDGQSEQGAPLADPPAPSESSTGPGYGEGPGPVVDSPDDWTFSGGPHKGETFSQVAQTDPKYLREALAEGKIALPKRAAALFWLEAAAAELTLDRAEP